ncbi:MAG: hypothetical protein HS109_01160 [Burkholderiales bacterium]|nr:hypothetical protein [Burkholderiales bacterium]MCE7878941.1 hypothetical protein [Betaproteobacteria bacterium PRO3]
MALKKTARIVRRACAAITVHAIAWGSALAQPVAVVTDVQGAATLAGASVAMLQQLDAGRKVDLAAGARVALIYYANGAQYELRGPGFVSVDVQQPHASQGATVHARAAPGPATMRLKPTGLVQGAVVMRNLGLRVIAPDPQVLSMHPDLAWTDSRTGTVYDVAVIDASGAAVFETTTPERRVKVPEARPLVPGQAYALQVKARVGSEVVQVARAEFRVAPAELQAQAKALAPAADAAVSERVAYALWLEQNDLRDEARRRWAAVAAARPDQGSLRERADAR